MRTAWPAVRGTGACSGRECRSARERGPSEHTPLSLTGTHARARACARAHPHWPSMLTIIPSCACVSISHLHPLSAVHLPSLHPPGPALPPPPIPHPCVCACGPVRTVCTVPLIDSINGQKYTVEPQGGGDDNGFARGAWDWSMLWKRVPLGAREKNRRKTETEPYRYTNPGPATGRGLIRAPNRAQRLPPPSANTSDM